MDFESTTNYTFTVTATDGGGLSDESIVEVTVLNVNDHQPRFEQDVYTVAIDEGDYSSSAVFLLNVSFQILKERKVTLKLNLC